MSTCLRNLREVVEAMEAAQKSNDALNSFSNHGKGNQNYAGPNTNSGAFSGNGNHHLISNNYGGGAVAIVNNSGNIYDHGNGDFFRGNFDASTRSYGF